MSEDVREFGHDIKLNHQPCTCNDHIKKHSKEIQKIQNNSFLKANKALLPSSFSLSNTYTLAILDQLNLGSCVANSYAAVIQSLYKITPSRLYLYFNGRVGTQFSPAVDSGLDLLQSMPIFKSFGIVPEANWGYNVSKFSTIPPYNTTYRVADITKLIITQSVPQTDEGIKTALSVGKFILFGFLVYPSFMSSAVASTGIVPLPSANEKPIGGHCVHIVGWCTYNNGSYYICRNSWGVRWGNDGSINPSSKFKNNGSNGGFFHIPVAYLLNTQMAFEFVSVGK